MLNYIRDIFRRIFAKPRKESKEPQKVVIYTDMFFRGASVPDEIKKRKPNAMFRLSELTPWEHRKSPNDNCIKKWVDETLLPELNKNGVLKPIVVWMNKKNKKNYVIDGHHRLIAYKKMNWKKQVPAVVVNADEVIMTDWTPNNKIPHP